MGDCALKVQKWSLQICGLFPICPDLRADTANHQLLNSHDFLSAKCGKLCNELTCASE